MSPKPGQGRGQTSPSRQRSPEELAALLARLADSAGDPEPRHARGAERRGVRAPAFPPAITPPLPAEPLGKPAAQRPPVPIIEVQTEPVAPPEQPRAPEPEHRRAPDPEPGPGPSPERGTTPSGGRDAGAGLIAGTPLNQAAGMPTPPSIGQPAERGANRPGVRPLRARRGERPQRSNGKAQIGPAARRRNPGRGAAGSSRLRRTQPRTSRPRQLAPDKRNWRKPALILVGLVALAILIAELLSGGAGNQVAKPASSSAPAPPPPATFTAPSNTVPATTTSATSSPRHTTARAAKQRPKPAAHKASPPHKASPAHKASSPPANPASAGTSSASNPVSTPAQAQPVYRAPAPHYYYSPPPPARQSLTTAGSLGTPALLSQHHAGHHKKG